MFTRIAARGIEWMRNSRLFSTIYHEVRLRRAGSIRAQPVLVFQMGKVASSSIFETLRAANLASPIFHIHFLNPDSIRLGEDKLWNVFGGRCSVNRWALYESRYVRKHFLSRQPASFKIISLVRDPVARNLSSFFANLDLFIPDCAARFDKGTIGVDDIRRYYLRDFHEHKYPMEWFDREMKSTFDIDVFADDHLLHRARNAFFFKRDQVDLLVLRVEDLADVAPQALEEFLGLTGVTLQTANEAQGKEYDRVYRAVIDELKLPSEYLDQVYSSRIATRFYGKAEIERFRSRWSDHDA